METITHNNPNNGHSNNNQRPHPTKSRSNGNFSNAAVQKTDVGDFQGGYFVMVDMPVQTQKPRKQQQERTKSAEKGQQRPLQPQPHRARSNPDLDSHQYQQQREQGQREQQGDSNVSHRRFQTSPQRSPTRTNNYINKQRNSNSPPSQSTDSNNVSLSPHKPRKAHQYEKRVQDGSESNNSSVSNIHVESGSPMKDKGPSPLPTRWAGPAFSNAPPPSSLPIPDFPPFPQAQGPQASSSSPTEFLTHTHTMTYQEQFFPMVYSSPVPFTHYHHNGHHSFAEIGHGHQSLAQLSTDLRKMLNITSEPVFA